ncbi:MAG: hypothetical protein EPN98_17600 [Phenylobacterium sp.]|uniref:hypothetical protein n=1 Tax=Phenylobacterium sp. TaxID=1871053 RepID=UPI00121C76A5|nr:hypothetical protein [Phenylobacterium sp.]TAL30488.1 MAG: hypothetical protein EPN98_17600 [Phenylobacterium sp.]
MPSVFRSRAARLVLPALLAAFVAACAESPKVVAPPPPPPAPVVQLSPRLVELASAYRLYVNNTTAIAPAFADGEAIAASLRTGVQYEPQQLAKGAIAYGAVVALQDRAFVEGVRIYAKDATQRRQVAYEILKDPAYAVGLNGSASAAGQIIAALGGDAQRLYDNGKAVKQAAYDIQKQPWSKADVPARDVRLANAKSLSAAAMTGSVDETVRLQQASSGAAVLGVPTGAAVAPPYTQTVVRALAVAALAALGEAGDANVNTVLGLVTEPNVGMCMNMSKLNLYQCLAVARPHYEDVFCLGQHGMMDTGRCMIRAAGLPEPYEARFIPSQESINKGMQTKKPPAKRKPVKKKS